MTDTFDRIVAKGREAYLRLRAKQTKSERVREARDSVAMTLCEALSMSALGHNPSGEEPCAYCTKRVGNAFAIVRAEVLEEVAEVVETHRLDSPYDLSGL